MTIRAMTIDDYEEVYALWMSIRGFAMRSLDDSRDGVARFLKRNPDTSVVAVADGKVVGSILCGYDGRRDAFTMCASARITADRASERRWWYTA